MGVVCVCVNPSTAVRFSSPNALKLWLFFIRFPNALPVFFSWQPEQNKPSLKAAQIILLINNVVGVLETCIYFFSAVVIGKEVQWWNSQPSHSFLFPLQSVCLSQYSVFLCSNSGLILQNQCHLCQYKVWYFFPKSTLLVCLFFFFFSCHCSY